MCDKNKYSYYEILNIEKDSLYDIKTVAINMFKIAYYKGSEEDMREIAEAYTVLSNPKEKKRYDEALLTDGNYSYADRLPSTYNSEDIYYSVLSQIKEAIASYKKKISYGVILILIGIGFEILYKFKLLHYNILDVHFISDVCRLGLLIILTLGNMIGGIISILIGIKEFIFFRSDAWYKIDIKW